MRSRSITIYAKDQEDYQKQLEKSNSYKQDIKQNDNINEEFNKKINSTEKNQSIIRYHVEEEIKLAHDIPFQIKMRVPTLLEQQVNDERKVQETISKIKHAYDNHNFTDNIDIIKYLFLQELHTNTRIEYDKQYLINQNFCYSNQVLKFIVIGDEGVGKTWFVKNMKRMMTSGYDKVNMNDILPTDSLNIEKFNTKIEGRMFSVQVFDTNSVIASSPMIKRFFLLMENRNHSSLDFIENHIGKIINFSMNPKNIFLVIINHKKVTSDEEEKKREYEFNLSLIKILDKYDLNDKRIITIDSIKDVFVCELNKFFIECSQSNKIQKKRLNK